MSDPNASLPPLWRDLGVPALVVAAVVAGVRWLGARWRAWRQRRTVAAARARYCLAAADGVRLLMLAFWGSESARPEPDEMQSRAAVTMAELGSARRALWRAEGRPDPEEDPEGAEAARELLREARRAVQTQRFHGERQDMFREEDGSE